MPLELIPNQPYIFEQALYDQPCLNSDTNDYGQLVAPGDTICVQQIMLPCQELLLCSPNMNYGDGAEIVVTWDTSGGWTSSGGDNASFDGATTGTDLCEYIDGALITGLVYRLAFTISSLTGDAGVIVQLGNDSCDTYDALGDYECYLIAQTAGDSLQLVFSNLTPTASDTIEITNIELLPWVSDCWTEDVGDTPTSGWRYSYDEETLLGKYCCLGTVFTDIVNSDAYVTDGNYHRVTVNISSCTAGGVEVILGGTYLGTTYSNGTFYFYGIPNDASLTLILRPVDSFDGCISECAVDDFGFLDNDYPVDSVYGLEITNESGVASTDRLPFVLNDDRITWCFNIDDILNDDLPIELPCDAGNRIKITAACAEQEPIEYLSVNTLRYDNAGWPCTYVMESQNDGYAFGFFFGSTTNPVFSLIQRLRILQFAPRYPAESEEYLYSNGRNSRSWAQSGKIRQAWVDYTSEMVHDVIRLQLLSDLLIVDGDIYFSPVKDYEPEWDDHKRNLSQSRFDLIKASELALFNRSCEAVSQTGCPPDTITPPVDCDIRDIQMVASWNLDDVDPTDFGFYFGLKDSGGTSTGNDVTVSTASIKAYFESYITAAGPYGMDGVIYSSSVVYNAGTTTLTINITGQGNIARPIYPFVFIAYNIGSHPANVLAPQII